MINLEQIQKLETRINKAVELIRTLKMENQNLRKTLDSTQARLQELEKLVGDFKSDQKEIEHCILRALENLDELEDEIDEEKTTEAADEKTEDQEGEENRPIEAREETESSNENNGNEDGSRELDIF